jgi:hypothetical protein
MNQQSTISNQQSAIFRRTIHPEIRVIDAKAGLAEYVASDETVDSYREVIRANGWRFDLFAKNAPFVDSHQYDSLDRLLGQVVDFKVEGKRLVETVQWAIDVPENRLAQIGWRMTEAGYLKAVSVGFRPVRAVSRFDADNAAWLGQLLELGLSADTSVRTIYTEQQQLELSAVIIGANPNALARAHKADAISEADLEFLDQQTTSTARDADDPGDASRARRRVGLAVLVQSMTEKL